MSLIVVIPSTIQELFLFIVVVRSQGCVNSRAWRGTGSRGAFIPSLESLLSAQPEGSLGDGAWLQGLRQEEPEDNSWEKQGGCCFFISPQRLTSWGLGMMLMDYTMICFHTEVFRGTVEHAKTAFLPTQNMMLLRAHMPSLFSNVFGKK